MTNRNQAFVAIVSVITIGIYFIYWLAKTRGEMNERKAEIPTTWLAIVPFANLWYFWRWTKGVETVSKNKTSAGSAFLLLGALPLGLAYLQDAFNNVK